MKNVFFGNDGGDRRFRLPIEGVTDETCENPDDRHDDRNGRSGACCAGHLRAADEPARSLHGCAIADRGRAVASPWLWPALRLSAGVLGGGGRGRGRPAGGGPP